MPKTRVAVFALCGTERHNWINPELSVCLFQMARDTRFALDYCLVKDTRPFETARNLVIQQARDNNFDWAISIDNDNFLPGHRLLDILQAAGPEQQSVIGLRCAYQEVGYSIVDPNDCNGPVQGSFEEVQKIGGAVLMIHRRIWETIPGPWFRWQYEDNELHNYPPRSRVPSTGCGEDTYFCRLVRSRGFKVWTHTQLAGHYKTVDLTAMVNTFASLSQKAN